MERAYGYWHRLHQIGRATTRSAAHVPVRIRAHGLLLWREHNAASIATENCKRRVPRQNKTNVRRVLGARVHAHSVPDITNEETLITE